MPTTKTPVEDLIVVYVTKQISYWQNVWFSTHRLRHCLYRHTEIFLLQVNYLSHFLVIAHLLPIMRVSGADCRIILVASNAYEVSSFNVEKIQAKTGEYGAFRYYAKSKLYQVRSEQRKSRICVGYTLIKYFLINTYIHLYNEDKCIC